MTTLSDSTTTLADSTAALPISERDPHRAVVIALLADMTRDVIGQNVWLAFGVSLALIALAARGTLNPLTGALAQSVAVFIVVANSARILRFGAPEQPSPRAARASASAPPFPRGEREEAI